MNKNIDEMAKKVEEIKKNIAGIKSVQYRKRGQNIFAHFPNNRRKDENFYEFEKMISENLDILRNFDTILDSKIKPQNPIENCGRLLIYRPPFPKFTHKSYGFIDEKYLPLYNLYLSLNKQVVNYRGANFMQNHNDYISDNIYRDGPLRRWQCYYIAKDLIKYTETQPDQRSNDWHTIRGSYCTASMASNYVDENHYCSLTKTLREACGIDPQFIGNEATEFGTKYEPLATLIYEDDMNKWFAENSDDGFSTTIEVVESAFVKSNNKIYPFVGGSPDGIVLKKTKYNDQTIYKEGYGIEIKCPMNRFPRGSVPRGYWMQMQMQLEVTNLEKAYFLDFKFKEYQYFDEFDENSGWCKKKGVVIEVFDEVNENDTKITTIYSPIYESDFDNNRIETWVNNVENKYLQNKNDYVVNYWILTTKYYTKVMRDRKWFTENAHKFRDYWYNRHYYSHHFCELIDSEDFVEFDCEKYGKLYDEICEEIPEIYEQK